MTLLYILISVLIISSVSLIGVFTLSVKEVFLKKILLTMVAFSAGALIGDAFIHLLPEAMEKSNSLSISLSIFAGITAFFLLEKFLRWRHCHDLSCHDHPHHLGMINLVGDGMHNLIDGLLIGASFVISIPLGISTSLAVILHEIPQELGDFGVLLHSGFTVKKALFFNFLSASVAIPGAIIAYFIGSSAQAFNDFMVPFTIGSFIYIALSDLIPELHKETSIKQTLSHTAGLFAGIGVMFLLLLLE